MRIEQYASDAKAYIAIAGGFTVSSYSLDAWAAYASLFISVMVISEKLPAFIGRIKSLFIWVGVRIKGDEKLNDYFRAKTHIRPGLIFSAVLSIVVFIVLFYLGEAK